MSKCEAEAFVVKAIRHARERRCLDDAEIVREWCERRTDSDTPEAVIGEIAKDRGLIDSQD